MSQIPPPIQPPLPEIPPLPPLAGVAYQSGYAAQGRPGMVTAIGIISIVVAGLSFLGSLYGGFTLFIFAMMANFAGVAPPNAAPPATVATPVATTQAASPAAETLAVSPRGLDATARDAVAAGLADLRFISAPRLDQLHTLLAQSGQDIFPDDGKPLTAQRVQDELVQSHVTGLSADPSAAAPDTVRTEGGRFELYDDRAVFYPTRGEIVRVSATTTSNAALTAAQVETIVQQAQSVTGNALNPAQGTALRTLLTTAGQQFVSPITVPTAIRSGQAMGDGTVFLTFPNGFASIGPQGQVTSSNGAGGGPFLPGARVRINRTAMALAMFATLVGFGLAVYLLVIGIFTLRGSPRGRKLHLIYAGLKIPVTILAAAAAWWVTTSFLESLMGAGGPSNPMLMQQGILSGVGTQHAVMAAIGLIYPVALLIALQTTAVKEYYRSEQ